MLIRAHRLICCRRNGFFAKRTPGHMIQDVLSAFRTRHQMLFKSFFSNLRFHVYPLSKPYFRTKKDKDQKSQYKNKPNHQSRSKSALDQGKGFSAGWFCVVLPGSLVFNPFRDVPRSTLNIHIGDDSAVILIVFSLLHPLHQIFAVIHLFWLLFRRQNDLNHPLIRFEL